MTTAHETVHHCPRCQGSGISPVDDGSVCASCLGFGTALPRQPLGALPLTTGQLAVWLDALTRQYGPDMPLYVQAGTHDAPAEVCLDAHVQRGPGGKRVVVLSAQTLPRKEG